jgi:peptidoglycan/LPS O-acetylase OafA/YrhL
VARSVPHIPGLDSLRSVAALWVVFSHGAAFPLRALLSGGGYVAQAIGALYGMLFNGVAAVIVFFLISGFCIHFPWARASRFDTGTFLLRRCIRVGGPLIVVWLIIACSPDNVAAAGRAVLWTVYCELIYYLLYPAIFRLFLKFGIRKVLAAATAVSSVLIITHWPTVFHWQFGIGLTWLVGLPSWLLGCLIAGEMSRCNGASHPRPSIWLWRAGAWAFTVAAVFAISHSPVVIGYPATLLVFSFYCYFWLLQELHRYASSPPSALLEWAGTWSYSLYLTHNLVITAWPGFKFPLPPLIDWAAKFAVILAASYAFYRAVEFPCHVLARKIGRRSAFARTANAGG